MNPETTTTSKPEIKRTQNVSPLEADRAAAAVPNNQSPIIDHQSRQPTRGLSRLAGLFPEQLDRINTWLDEAVSYRKIAELCGTEFQLEVPHMTIARYYKRSAPRKFIEDLTDDLTASKQAAAEISKYAATGDATFSTTTLELLEQKAFDFALAFNRDTDADDLASLKQLWSLIHKAKNTSIRERHAKVQERKADLRRDELAFKKQLAESREARQNHRPSPHSPVNRVNPVEHHSDSPDQSTDSEQSKIKNQKSEIPLEPFPSDETLAAWGVKPEYLLPLQRGGMDLRTYIPTLCRHMNRTIEEFFRTLVRNREYHENQRAEQSLHLNPNLIPTPDKTSLDPNSKTSDHSLPNPVNLVNPVKKHSEQNPENNQSSPCAPSASSAVNFSSLNQKSKNGAKTDSEPENNQSSIIHNQSPDSSPSALAATVDAYTVRRAQEYWAHRRYYSDPAPPGQSHPEYITQYKHCPCGARTPCPTHEAGEFRPFPRWFWTLSPHSTDYANHLIGRGLPYREPREFL